MNSQILTQPLPNCSFFHIFQLADFPSEMPIQVSPMESGFEIDEAELAGELSALAPEILQPQTNMAIDPLDFEDYFTWFLS